MDHREAVARLYQEFGPAVYRRCLRLLRDPEAAQGATQEVFMRLVRSLNVIRDSGRRGEAALGISKRTVSRGLERFLSSSRRFTGGNLS